MRPHWRYGMWQGGELEQSVTIPLDSEERYLVTGHLTGTDGDDYAHVYISELCTLTGVISCGIRDWTDDQDLRVVEFVDNAISVTIKLKTEGGWHRAEGVVYEY